MTRQKARAQSAKGCGEHGRNREREQIVHGVHARAGHAAVYVCMVVRERERGGGGGFRGGG